MPHSAPIKLKQYGSKTTVYFTLDNPRNLIVFIHGFIGNATTTWYDFPMLVRSYPEFSDSDIVFYGYDSVTGHVSHKSLHFYNFLVELIEKKLRINSLIERHNEYDYEKIIFAAHSLGSIVLRRGLLFAKAGNRNWLNRTRMLLFAPAHKGASPNRIIYDSLSSYAKVLAGMTKLALPVFENLEPASQTIRSLTNDSNLYINAGQGDFTRAFAVIWAETERYVHPENFCIDPPPEMPPGTNHFSVCKPSVPNYMKPFDILVNSLT